MSHDESQTSYSLFRPLTRRQFLEKALVATGGAVLAGCSPAAAPAVTTAPGKPATAAVQKPLVIAAQVLPKELDPDFAETTEKGNILRQLTDMPTWFDDKGELHPQAFESWQLMNENKTWRCKICKGIRFQDGKALDANTAKFTFDRMVDKKMLDAGAKNLFPSRVGLEKVEVVDDYTLDFHTKSPNNLFPIHLYVVYLINPEFYRTASLPDAATKVAGSGPYKLTEFAADDHITVVSNPDYWQGKPQIEQITFRAVPEKSSRLAMLETGEADIALDLSAEDMDQIKKIPHARVSWIEGARRVAFHLNLRKPYLKDKRVRQALNYAIDWEPIKNSLFGGLGARLITYRGSSVWANPNIKAYPYDPQNAKDLLAAAKFPMDQMLLIDVASSNQSRISVCQAIVSQWAKIGVKAEVKPLEGSVLDQMVFKRTIDDMVILGLGGRGNPIQDPPFSGGTGQWDPTDWTDEQYQQYDKLKKEMTSIFDEARQRELSYKLEEIVYDASPWVFLYRDLVVAGVNKRVKWDVRVDGQIFFAKAGWAS